MSIFSELLPKINEIYAFTKNFNDDLKVAFDYFDKFEEEFRNGRSKAREKTQKDKNAMTTLQSINEDEVESNKPQTETKSSSSKKSSSAGSQSSNEEPEKRASKKRSKNEVDGIFSPEQDKRVKRSASVKAQSIISQQVNVNLTQKLRREKSIDRVDKTESSLSARSRRQNENKENLEPNNVPLIQVKQEKISFVSEPELMDAEDALPINIEVKQEVNKDDIAMPPPAVPIPRPRKAVPKEKSQAEETSEDESSSRRRTTRNKKQTDTATAPPVPSARPRGRGAEPEAASGAEPEAASVAEPEARPKRTRGRKKLSTTHGDTEKELSSQDSLPASPAEKPRPKRTRRGKAAEKEQPKPIEPESIQSEISPKEEKVSESERSSYILPQKETKTRNKKENTNPDIELAKEKQTTKHRKELAKTDSFEKDSKDKNGTTQLAKTDSFEKDAKNKNGTTQLAKTDSFEKDAKTKNSDKELTKTKNEHKLAKAKVGKELADVKKIENDQVDVILDETKIIKPGDMDQTVVLPNGVYNHDPITPKTIRTMNETVVLEQCERQTMVLDKPQNAIMDATIVIDKGTKPANITEDNSLLTDDSDSQEDAKTPPRKQLPETLPSSAVKEKVQQFEEMASRVTRTKTRAIAKKEQENENQTPPDKTIKPVLSSETLSKMNNLIFNGKAPQISNSACKPRANVPPAKTVTSSSASKVSTINKLKEAAEESLIEDARKKKEAILEAKRELQRRKREEKMAAAALARSLAEQARHEAQEAAARSRSERQAHADLGRAVRGREAERKKQDLARKVAETEERRKAEEMARQRLAEEQRRAMELRKKQIEEQEAMKRGAAKMAKEIEQKQREYIEKQKKQRHEDKMHTPFKTPSTAGGHPMVPMRPVHMEDGFQYLNSDEEEEPPDRPIPQWSTSAVRRATLQTQFKASQQHVDRLFSVRVHSPDLRLLFPSIERARLKRTSSAVWRTPPPLPPLQE